MPEQQKARDLRAKTSDELKALLLDTHKEHFNLRFQQATGQQEGIKNMKILRRLIARIKTIMAESKCSAVKAGA